MSEFGYPSHGFSLKALLEDPNLQTAPNVNSGQWDVKKPGKVGGYMPNVNSAFLGPRWDKPSCDNGSKFDLEYMDLDEFLTENGIPVNLEENDDAETINLLASALAKTPPHSPNAGSPGVPIGPPSPLLAGGEKVIDNSDLGVYIPEHHVTKQAVSPGSLSPLVSPRTQEPSTIERYLLDDNFGVKLPKEIPVVNITSNSSKQSDKKRKLFEEEELSEAQVVTIPGAENFDPTSRKFTEDELKPQPVIKKSKKVFVDDLNKDDRYWQRRKKNNIAAKRSRDARRVKENQIAMRAAFLEQENDDLKEELERVQRENEELIKRLSKYEKV